MYFHFSRCFINMYIPWFVVVVSFNIHFVFYNNYKFKLNSCSCNHVVVFCSHWCCISISFYKVNSSTSMVTLYEETTLINKLIVPMEKKSSSKVNI